MHYDTTLKALLHAASENFFRQVVGAPVVQWLNTETPQVQNLRLDLLGLTRDSELIHIELQRTNDSNVAFRIAEYYLRIGRQTKQFAAQVVLYVGEPALNMASEFITPSMHFSFTLLDIRQLNTEALMASPNIGDNLLAILTNLSEPSGTIREILIRIAALPEPDRKDYRKSGLVLSRVFRKVVREGATIPLRFCWRHVSVRFQPLSNNILPRFPYRSLTLYCPASSKHHLSPNYSLKLSRANRQSPRSVEA